MTREVLRDAITYLPAKVVPSVAGILAIPILTHLLSPEKYGQYLLVLSSLTFISIFCVSWLASVVIRFNTVYGVEILHSKLKNILSISIMAGCLIWIVVSINLLELPEQLMFLTAGMVWLITQGLYDYYSSWFRVRGMAKFYSIAVSWRSIGGLAIATILVFALPNDPSNIFYGFAIVMIIGLLFMRGKAVRCDSDKASINIAALEYGSVLKYGIPAALTSLMISGLSLADRLMINWLMGPESVAIYGANYDIAEKTIFFANSTLLLSSSIIGLRIYEKDGEDKASIFLTKLMRLYLILAPPLALIIALAHKEITHLLLPPSYHDGAIVLAIVAFGGLFVGILHRYSLALSFRKRTDIIMVCSMGALGVNLSACYLFIPLYGLAGAAISTVIAYAAWFTFIRIASIGHFRIIFPWGTFFRVCIGLLTATAFCFLLGLNYVISPLLSIAKISTIVIVIYLLTLSVIKEFSYQEISNILKILKIR